MIKVCNSSWDLEVKREEIEVGEERFDEMREMSVRELVSNVKEAQEKVDELIDDDLDRDFVDPKKNPLFIHLELTPSIVDELRETDCRR